MLLSWCVTDETIKCLVIFAGQDSVRIATHWLKVHCLHHVAVVLALAKETPSPNI